MTDSGLSMETRNNKKREKPTELYLKVPYHILNIPQLGLSEKVLLAHFYSFGAKGCWQSNATLADVFMTSSGTISRWIASLRKYIQVKCPKGYYRTIWAKSHPDVLAAGRALYESKKTSKPDKAGPLHLSKNAEHPPQKCVSDCSKSAFPLTQKCVTTNNNTIKETTGETTATPAPLPAGGQAPALLVARTAECQAVVDDFYKKFGRPKHPPPQRTPEEIERMRREAIEQFESILKTRAKQAVTIG